jgi:hypothetical protein
MFFLVSLGWQPCPFLDFWKGLPEDAHMHGLQAQYVGHEVCNGILFLQSLLLFAFPKRVILSLQRRGVMHPDVHKASAAHNVVQLFEHTGCSSTRKFHREEIMLPTPLHPTFLRVSQNYQVNKQHQTINSRKLFLEKQSVGIT